MVLTQVSVRFHAQRAAIFVPEPARNSGNIYAALDANRRKKMAKIVMRNAFHSDFRRRMRHTVLAMMPLEASNVAV